MPLTWRLISLCVAALLMAGCAEQGTSGSFGSFGLLGGAGSRPKTIAVSDFVFPSDVVAVDRGFTARLERKVGGFPTHERKQRTNERVNDEIVAAIVVSLREAGLDAQPGNEDTLALMGEAVIVSGSLRAVDPEAAKKNQAGFGSGRSGVAADMTIMRSKGQLLGFTAEGGKRPGPPPAGKLAASRNAMFAESLTASKAAAEKLSPDVEAQARSLGRAIGAKVVEYAKGQGWLTSPESAAVTPAAEQRVRLPDPKPAQKPAGKKPSKPAAPDADDQPDAPDKR
jgi:hypothetical protein